MTLLNPNEKVEDKSSEIHLWATSLLHPNFASLDQTDIRVGGGLHEDRFGSLSSWSIKIKGEVSFLAYRAPLRTRWGATWWKCMQRSIAVPRASQIT